jgi:hypothetical protein
MTAPLPIDRALLDPRLLRAALGDPSSWRTWLVTLKAAFGQSLDAEELETFVAVAGNRSPPTQRVRELWAIIGRRGGKSRIAAAIAVFIACFVRHKLSPGERGMVLVLASSVEQAKVAFGYALSFLQESGGSRGRALRICAGPAIIETHVDAGAPPCRPHPLLESDDGRTDCGVGFVAGRK